MCSHYSKPCVPLVCQSSQWCSHACFQCNVIVPNNILDCQNFIHIDAL
jgi:hypothetical protein